MMGIAGYDEVTLGLAALGVFGVLAAALLLARGPRVHSGRANRRCGAVAAGKRFAGWLSGAILIMYALGYAMDARTRMTECIWERSFSNEDGGLYTAEYCNLKLDKVLLRVYRTSDSTLLAERTYRYLDAPKVTWTKDRLVFDTYENGDGGSVPLPPTLLDRTRARLP